MDNNQNSEEMQKNIDNIFNEVSNLENNNINSGNNTNINQTSVNSNYAFGAAPIKKKKNIGIIILILGLLILAASVFFLFLKPSTDKDTKNDSNNTPTDNNSNSSTKEERKENEKEAFKIKLYGKEINIYTSFASTIKSATDNFTLYYRNKDIDSTKDFTVTQKELEDYLAIDKSCNTCANAIILHQGTNGISQNNSLLSIKGDALTNKKAYTLSDLKVFRVEYPLEVGVNEKPEIDINGFKFNSGKTTKEDVINFFGSTIEENSAGRGFGYVDYNKSGFNLSFWYASDNNSVIEKMTIDQKLK